MAREDVRSQGCFVRHDWQIEEEEDEPLIDVDNGTISTVRGRICSGFWESLAWYKDLEPDAARELVNVPVRLAKNRWRVLKGCGLDPSSFALS